MEKTILSGEKMPFCPGCGHGPSVKYLSKALTTCGYLPLDIILVSDIGCSGLVDPLFATHTIHGLHGRSSALALGIALANSDKPKKVVAIQGDGGATIGLQHLLEASRRNLDMTMIVLNNLIYGMTGGQVSGLSTTEFKYEKAIPDKTIPFDVCALAHTAGASFVSRVNDPKKIEATLVQALQNPGFSLVEISSLCQPYGAKKLTELQEWARPEVTYENGFVPPTYRSMLKPSLFKESEILQPRFSNTLNRQLGILIAGSAGGGVQSAAKLLARAGMLSGLAATMKGEYPITVGTGFSVAEVILAKEEINYTGLEQPDVIIVVTNDGLRKIIPRIHQGAKLYFDNQVEFERAENCDVLDFMAVAGTKGAALAALAYWILNSDIIPIEALKATVATNKYSSTMESILNQVALINHN